LPPAGRSLSQASRSAIVNTLDGATVEDPDWLKSPAVFGHSNHAGKDRVVLSPKNFQLNASELLISFVDGSTMTITIAECNSLPLCEGARIRQISEDQAKFLLECEDDSIFGVTMVDPGNSVILRDKNGQVEYLG
jgi:hypothetical protein